MILRIWLLLELDSLGRESELDLVGIECFEYTFIDDTAVFQIGEPAPIAVALQLLTFVPDKIPVIDFYIEIIFFKRTKGNERRVIFQVAIAVLNNFVATQNFFKKINGFVNFLGRGVIR